MVEEKEENVWESLLKDASVGSRVSPGRVLILGDKGSGKRSLVNGLVRVSHRENRDRGSVEPEEEEEENYVRSKSLSVAGLGYTYLEPVIEEGEDVKVSLFAMQDQDPNLLRTALPSSKNALVVIVVDLSKPAGALQCLRKWLDLVQTHFDSIDSDSREQLEDYLRKIEPAQGDLSTFASMSLASTDQQKHAENEQQPLREQDAAGVEAIPLRKGLLTTFVGVPLLVVGTKSDVFSNAAEDMETEMRLEFIQRHLRTICMEYGASLTYTSTKIKLNIDTLLHYMLHRLYPHSIPLQPVSKDSENQQPVTSAFAKFVSTSRDAVHVPAGWDRLELIEALANTKNKRVVEWSSDAPYEEIIKEDVPGEDKQFTTPEDEVQQASPHAEFLARLLAKQKLLPDAVRATSGDAAAAALKAFNTSASSMQTGIKESSSSATVDESGGAPSTRRTVTAKDAKENPALIADFFQNLLNRDKGASQSNE